MKTVGIFVDVSNIYYCTNKAFPGHKVDYLKYQDKAVGNNAIYRAVAFGVQNNDESARFISCLRHLNYDARFKKFDPRNPRINCNIAIATELFRTIDKLDIVILGSADPNLVDLVTWIKERGTEVHIIACGISHYLKEVATKFIEIDESFLEDIDETKE